MSHGQKSKAAGQTPSHGSNPTSHGVKTDDKNSGKRDRTVEEIVSDCWAEIETKCAKEETQVEPAAERSGWRALRLFVSSTFHDYHSEREVLVKRVFPELREWCLQRQLHLTECDLRWGVPKDSTTAAVLSTCLDEIERCHGDSDGQGMFLNMLGERYGWIPSVSDVPSDLAVQYRWVHNTSITHMEILLGAYFKQNRNAAFFIRNPDGWLNRLPKEVQGQFIDPMDIGRAQLKTLKSKLREKFPNQCFDYNCSVDEPEKAEGRPELKGLEKFGNDVLKFFKEAIAREYPATTPTEEEDKPGLREQFSHDCILEQKGSMVLGRTREYGLVLKYGKGEISPDEFKESWEMINNEEKNDAPTTAEDDHGKEATSSDDQLSKRNVIAVIAEPGAGKSSLLARCALEAKKVNLDVFVHFIGCSGMSTSHTNVMKRLCFHLLSSDDPRAEKVDKSEDTLELQDILNKLLEERNQAGTRLLIIVDDLSQLTKAEGYLNWIPKDGLPSHVTIVTSMVQGDNVVDEVKEQSDRITWVNLGYLTNNARYDIVASYLKRYNKTLDPEQTKLLVETEGAKNALWLSMACEELRVFGVFELLTGYIKELPSSLDNLLEKILTRLVKEDETELLKETLCFMECVREGLREKALQLILGEMDEKKSVPMLHWAMINRTLKPFIRISSNYQQLNQLTFYHQAIGKAVRKQWLSDEDALRRHHRTLADYFQYHCDDDHILAREAAYHMNCTKDGKRLLEFIKTDERARYIDAVSISRYIKEYKCRNMINVKHNIGGRQLFTCNFCCNSRQAFNKRQFFSNKDSCVLCGQFVSMKKPERMAYWCGRHPQRGPSFGLQVVCHICKRPVMKGKELPLYLCHFCHMGGFTTCCRTQSD